MGLGAPTAPGSWRAKAAAQLPHVCLDFEIIMCLTKTPKLALEYGPYIARCPSRRIATLVFSSSVGKVTFPVRQQCIEQHKKDAEAKANAKSAKHAAAMAAMVTTTDAT